ncbi:MAG: restriction endonuclease subunit S [Methylotenera sp.]|nr:restriction endonuclease subunit S [Methylotenera sp.]
MSELQETDFGNIPKAWSVAKIADLKANDKRAIAMGPFGSNIKAENFVAEGVPVIRGTNLNYSRYVDGNFVFLKEEKADELSGSNCKPGDLVFTHRGTIGQVGLIPHGKYARYVISQSGMKLTLNPDLMDSDFLLYFFKSEYGQYQILKYESQVGVPSISNPLTSLKEIQVPVPKIEEQKAIASVLSSLDDKIDLLHRQNTTLERMAETLFRQWFVEEAQEDWEDGTLGEVVEIFDNLRIPLSKMERDKKKDGVLYPYYGAAQIMDYINDYIFDGEYILMGEDGTVRTDEGYPVLQYATGKFWVNNHTHVLKAKPPYSNFLIWNYLSKKNIDEIVTGAVQPKINQGNLKALDFPKLPEHLVHEFNSQTEPMLTKINNNKKQIQTIEKLRDNLLPKLMNGEVRVYE